MPDRFKINRAETSAVVQRRFWGLLLLTLTIAVCASAIAVRQTAQPYLEAQQREVIASQLERDAMTLETELDRHRLLLHFVGNTSDVVNVAMGYVDNTDVVNDYLANLRDNEALSWISLFDVFGEEVARFDVRAEDRTPFPQQDILGLVSAISDEKPRAEENILVHEQGNISQIVMSIPVVHQGFTEGVVVAGFQLDRDSLFPMNEVSSRTSIVPTSTLTTLTDLNGSVKDQAVVARPLIRSQISVLLHPNLSAIEAVGQTLLKHTVSAIAAVLFLAFGIFAAAGRAIIVEPHKRLEQQRKSLSELAAIAERANDAIVVTDVSGAITWVNPAFEKLSGYQSSDVMGKSPGSFLQGEGTDPNSVAKLRRSIATQKPAKVELLNYRRTGEPYWVSVALSPLRNETGVCYGFVAITYDVTSEHEARKAILDAKKRIEHQALHDPLTELPNRRALDLALKSRTTSASAEATIVRIDLDHFKYVNDTLGHEAGDFVLCDVASILREETKAGDTPARVGGDEFVILLGPGNTSTDGFALAQRMLERIRAPKLFESKTIRVGASFGVASTYDGLLSIDDLIVGADAALYEAKDRGRNNVRLYTPELHKSVLDRRSLALEIRRALINEEFVPHYQPQFDAKSLEVVGVETLARWQSPTLGLVFPNQFLPTVEQLSAIDEMDSIIFNKAIGEIAELSKDGLEIPKLSFNVTAQRIQNPKVTQLLQNLRSGGPQIGFEILESVLVEEQTDLFNFHLDQLREMGVSIEIDDFGSGHASIVGLMHLRPDTMKIDQRLIMPITQSDTTRGLLAQIIGMARILGLKVTAEGVETNEHARILAEMGCHTLQGYAFSKPLAMDDLRAFLLSWDNRRKSLVRSG